MFLDCLTSLTVGCSWSLEVEVKIGFFGLRDVLSLFLSGWLWTRVWGLCDYWVWGLVLVCSSIMENLLNGE